MSTSIDYKEAREKMLKAILAESQEHIDEELAEIEAEIVDELLDDSDDQEHESDAITLESSDLPQDDEVMSRDDEGEPLCRYGDSTWYLIDQTGERVTFNFLSEISSYAIDYSEPQTAPLMLIQKLMLYSIWPGKDLTVRPYSVATVRNHHKDIRWLLNWFYTEGHFLSKSLEDIPNDIELISANDFKNYLQKILDGEQGSYTETRRLTSAIRIWLNLSKRAFCPEWFRPKFNSKNVVDKHMAAALAKDFAKKKNRWEAIEFDDLKPLFDTAQNYIEVYADDIFWLLDKFEEAYELMKARRKSPQAQIKSHEPTKELFDEVLNYSYAIDPQTNGPWFSPKILTTYNNPGDPASGIANYAIELSAVVRELRVLVGASTFILFTFTGKRDKEMRTLESNMLFVDGEEPNPNEPLLDQVEVATSFDLARLLYKMKKSPKGERHNTPLPKVAAKAYAMLIKALQFSRADTTKLFPPGGIKFPWHKSGYGVSGTNKSINKVSGFMRPFCETAGVDYVFPHKCRKTLATLLINDDPECLEVIQWLLGHNSWMMTYEYIMALPSISDEVLQYLKESKAKDIVEYIADTLDGHVSGAAGNRSMDAVVDNIDAWKGQKLDNTIRVLIKAYADANFTIHRTPAAWCVRFPSRVPHTAPCLPPTIQKAIESGESLDEGVVVPRFEHCIPWECGDAGHTRSDLDYARRSLRHAKKKANSSNRAELAHYKPQAEYWEKVVDQLENGRADIAKQHLLDGWEN